MQKIGGIPLAILNPRIVVGNSYDDATLAFIAKHEMLTGVAMETPQKAALNGYVRRLKGLEPGYVDLWTEMASRGVFGRIDWPSNDTTCSAAGYSINLINPDQVITWTGLIAGVDFTVYGVTGGTGKYGRPTCAPSDYPVSNAGYWGYCRTNSNNTGAAFGAIAATSDSSEGVYLYLKYTDNSTYAKHNKLAAGYDVAANVLTNTLGLIGVQRTGDTVELVQNAIIKSSPTTTPLEVTTSRLFAMHGMARSSGITDFDNRQFCGMWFGVQYLDAPAKTSFYNATQWAQTNAITGGRHV